jgi:hypothetical protein
MGLEHAWSNQVRYFNLEERCHGKDSRGHIPQGRARSGPAEWKLPPGRQLFTVPGECALAAIANVRLPPDIEPAALLAAFPLIGARRKSLLLQAAFPT